jgi:hypothetical protein
MPEIATSEEVVLAREQFLQLVELAEWSIITSDSEFSSAPTDAERELMLLAWRLAGKDMPEYFSNCFGWKTDSEVESE